MWPEMMVLTQAPGPPCYHRWWCRRGTVRASSIAYPAKEKGCVRVFTGTAHHQSTNDTQLHPTHLLTAARLQPVDSSEKRQGTQPSLVASGVRSSSWGASDAPAKTLE